MSVACVFSPVKIQFSDYTKCLISRIKEVYVFFNIPIAFLIEKTTTQTSIIFICFCYCFGMVSVMSVSRYVMSVSLYQSRSLMYIRGLIPQNWPRQFRLR